MIKKLVLYYNTLKYLKLSQIFYRILKRIKKSKVRTIEGLSTRAFGTWQRQELYPQKFINNTDVCFLNHTGVVKSDSDWNDLKQNKLWLYNLHYFDDLVSFRSDEREKLQVSWIQRWILENPPKNGGNGWESYTLSLRIVNWVKAFLSGLTVDKGMLDSLAQQADYLSRNLEKHLLGNHYFVNLKALLFAGCYFEGKGADRWLEAGLRGFEKEVKEQVLADGGNFELTPMYHSIMLTDLLDLYNLFQAFQEKIPEPFLLLTKKTISNMFGWLNAMSHGDDKISFFSDSTFGIAPDNVILREYAHKLGIPAEKILLPKNSLNVYNLVNTGYVAAKSREVCLIADLAPVGPNYIPGHAHADTLSFEMSLGGARLFVNSGISLYGVSEERIRQRSSSAHNTVVVNGLNSSEIWSGFRVARRAKIVNRFVGDAKSSDRVSFSAEHNGFKNQGVDCYHYRSWDVSLFDCTITDVVKGEFNTAVGFLHLHPNVVIVSSGTEECIIHAGVYEVSLNVAGAKISVEDSTWHPGFSISLKSHRIRLEYLQSHVTYFIRWIKL